ncbi:SAV_6107 family HEPN domain-containing protein [Saccharomonospora sp. NPDC046836]|uniref:SAV_6107 family HEPN domain-containing protein n=1 Tax=Saccharomonospora sp. NPDC046836 TaxID=3156921 RepID=UPI0034073131
MSVAFASRSGPESRQGPVQPALPIELRPPAAPAAVSLLTQARHGLAEAGREADPVRRFISAYLSALRAAAAVLAARGRPHRGRAKPESVWTLLESAAPELQQWAVFFAAYSARQAAAQAGVTRRITAESTDELFVQAGRFVAIAGRVVHGHAAARAAPCGARPRRYERRGG